MSTSQEQINALHQKASSHYLEGEFAAALETWRELLELDPENERALEGVRLCELLAEEGEGMASDDDAAAEQAPAEAAAAAPESTLDDLDELLESKLDRTSPAAAEKAAVEEQPDAALPDPSRQQEGIDFGEGAEPETLNLAGESCQPSASEGEVAPEFDFDFGELDEHVAPTPETAAATAAADGLRGRADELLAEARSAHEAGDLEAAQGILKRLFILDENHEQALALRQEILDARSESPVPDAGIGEAPALDLPPIAADVPAAPVPVPETASEPVADAPPAPTLEGSEADADLFAPIEAAETETETPPRSGAGVPRWAVIAVVVVVGLAGGLFLGLRYMRGKASTDPSAVAETGTPATQNSPARKPVAPEPGAKGQGPAAALDPQQYEEILARADAAFEVGDYAAAVVAYNEALVLDPQNDAITRQLTAAGELYREQQEIVERWRDATRAYEEGSYRRALTLFYRLPEDEDPGRLLRYRRNGWYNLGLQALQYGRCREAREHLDEARRLDAADIDIAFALEMAGRCSTEGGTPDYEQDVSSLDFRGLEDGPRGA
jgi:tetratricopeptide (TPR) repeat protein